MRHTLPTLMISAAASAQCPFAGISTVGGRFESTALGVSGNGDVAVGRSASQSSDDEIAYR